MTPDQARKTRLNTDYPIDMVVGRLSGSRSVSTATSMSDAVLIEIPHNLGYAPLVIGTYSDDPSFNVYYKAGSSPTFFKSDWGVWWDQYNMTIESDETNIRIFLINWVSTRTFYFRVSMLAPTGTGLTPIPNVSQRQPVYINTDLNIMKIYESKRITYTLPPSGLMTVTIPHNLGIIPKAFIWSEADGIIRQGGNENAVGVTGVGVTTTVDTNNIYLLIDSFIYPTVTVHYRIYLD